MDDLLLGIDAGTSTIKAVAFSLDGDEVARSSRPNEVLTPASGRAEQDMRTTWQRAATVIRSVVDSISRPIAAVAVTGQGGGAWLLDANGDPVRNAILWTDGRAADYVRQWKSGSEFDAVFEQCGDALSTESSLALYRWLCEAEPATVEQIETAFFCKDWIAYQLTGSRVTDFSCASFTHLDPKQGTFSDEIASLLGVTPLTDRVPDPVSGTDTIGTVTSSAAAATGIPEGTPVVAGVVDVAASAFGSGVTSGGTSSIVGTTLQNQVLTDTPRISPPKVGYTLNVGVDGLGLRAMGAMTGTPNLDWVAQTLFDGTDISTIAEWARKAPIGSNGVMYHPYLSAAGEKAPFVEPAARAQFAGLAPEHTKHDLCRAVYEGVALSMRDCYEHLPTETERVYLGGGGARSDMWCQLFADCLDAEIVVPSGEEFGAKGAAILAGVGIGRYDDLETAIEATTRPDRTYSPDPAAVDKYSQLYELFVETRTQLRDVWRTRAAIFDGS